jgi:hypothetical protein
MSVHHGLNVGAVFFCDEVSELGFDRRARWSDVRNLASLTRRAYELVYEPRTSSIAVSALGWPSHTWVIRL